MPWINPEKEQRFLLQAAAEICMAARTAPKGKGKDLLVTAIVEGDEKQALIERMNLISQRDGLAFFARDAGNLEKSPVVVLFGSRKDPLRLPHCGYCGFPDCDAMLEAGGTCSFNTGDLGIALGSAASRAADLRLDNRIMYSAGKAALELGLLGDDVAIAYAIPLSVSGKSPFFDR
ncbi:MAG: ferredoxin [Deltaproteobacteria bacterium]|nr:MAG: ferredoxin [Deltaproteobacteria bacterium]